MPTHGPNAWQDACPRWHAESAFAGKLHAIGHSEQKQHCGRVHLCDGSWVHISEGRHHGCAIAAGVCSAQPVLQHCKLEGGLLCQPLQAAEESCALACHFLLLCCLVTESHS